MDKREVHKARIDVVNECEEHCGIRQVTLIYFRLSSLDQNLLTHHITFL